MKNLVYLAQPYSSSPAAAYDCALALTAREVLYDSNITLVSPIILFHEVAERYALPGHFKFWFPHNLALLSVCSEIRVICATGLYESIGCAVEIEFASHLKLPIRYYALDTEHSRTLDNQLYDRLTVFRGPRLNKNYEEILKQLEIEAGDKRARKEAVQLA